jgi:hypothetical protein
MIMYMKNKIRVMPAFCCALLMSTSSIAQTTTTTTTTNPDGSVTTQETTTQETTQGTTGNSRNLVGPAGVTGTIRRVERRDDYRQEQDKEVLKKQRLQTSIFDHYVEHEIGNELKNISMILDLHMCIRTFSP